MNKNVGFIIGLVAGAVLLAVLAVVGGIAWLAHQRAAIAEELNESAQEILKLNQAYTVTGLPGQEGKALALPTDKIDVLGLPAPVADSLKIAGVKTVGELAAKPKAELAAIKGIDADTVRDIETALKAKSLLGVNPNAIEQICP